MKNVLLITAHPAKEGFTHKIAETIIGVFKQSGDPVELIDLYKPEFRQDFYTYDEVPFPKEHTEKQKFFQKKVLWADELIFIFPVWAGDAPSILKNWFDCNWIPGFAYRFENGKLIQLLKNKSTKVICTYGTYSYKYIFLGITFAMKRIWKVVRVNFVGMKLKGFYAFGDFDTGRVNREKVLKKISKIAAK